MSDISRVEQLLRNALGEDIYEVTPQSRVEELLQQLNELIEDMGASVDPAVIEPIVTAWLEENIHDGSAAVVDSSLTIAGAAADAKKTGDEISGLKSNLNDVNAEVASLINFAFAQKSIEISKALEYYPFALNNGDVITIKNKSGQNFGAAWGLICYDSEKNTLGTYNLTTSQSERTVTVDITGTAYIRPNYALVDTVVISATTDGFNAEKRITENSDNITDILDGDLDYIPERINLFDASKVINGTISPTTGNVNSAAWFVSDFIPVKAGVTYYTGGFNTSGYNALYDKSKKYVSAVTTVTDENDVELWHFTPSVDGYMRGTLYNQEKIDIAYVSQFINSYREYTDIDFSYGSPADAGEIDQRAIGDNSNNLFTGGSNYLTFNSNTGVTSGSKYRLMTPHIGISGQVCYFVNSDLNGLVQYILEYDNSKTFIQATTLSGKPIGQLSLNSDTKYIRINTVGSLGANLPTPAEYDELLYVTDSLVKLNKFVSRKRVVTPKVTSYDFYNHSVTFKHSYILDAIVPYLESINLAGYDFVAPIMTDIHNIDPEPYSMLTYAAESGAADICLNLGDNIPDHYDDADLAIDFHKAISLRSKSPFAKCELLVLRGNHDNNPVSDNDADTMISNAEYFNLYHSRTIKGFAGINKNYGYIDFEQSKIRLIFIDSGDIYDSNGEPLTSGYNVSVGQDQIDWFCNDALNFADKAAKSEWSVITCSHAQFKQLSEEMFNDILEAFLAGTAASGSITQTFSDTGKSRTVTYDVDFSTQGAMEYICHLNGHNHWDDAFLMGNTGRYDIDICSDINNGGKRVNGSTQRYTYTSGTINERCMDTLCIDKANRKIYMKRLGVGEDREYTY